MAGSDAATPDEYIASLPPDRREAVRTVRDVVRMNLPAGFEEGMQYGIIGWYVPLERFPNTYNGQPIGIAALANQKNYMSLYLNTVYGDPKTEAWFKERYAASGKQLDMGKSCVRFRRLEDLPLDVIGDTIARVDLDSFLGAMEEARGSSRRTRAAANREP
jgi:uncharacterized protein YdhG (YjbR/CyaY superfamily)